MQHIVIVGKNGVGKSTVIRSLLHVIPCPVYGVITKKEAPDPDGFSPVYIRRYGESIRDSERNRIGLCREQKSVAFPEVFDCFAETMQFPGNGVIVFDELGFLESNAARFTGAVLGILDAAPMVIAAVRDKQTPFLDAVRNHPRADVFRIDEQNRDALRVLLTERLISSVPDLFPDP